MGMVWLVCALMWWLVVWERAGWDGQVGGVERRSLDGKKVLVDFDFNLDVCVGVIGGRGPERGVMRGIGAGLDIGRKVMRGWLAG